MVGVVKKILIGKISKIPFVAWGRLIFAHSQVHIYILWSIFNQHEESKPVASAGISVCIPRSFFNLVVESLCARPNPFYWWSETIYGEEIKTQEHSELDLLLSQSGNTGDLMGSLNPCCVRKCLIILSACFRVDSWLEKQDKNTYIRHRPHKPLQSCQPLGSFLLSPLVGATRHFSTGRTKTPMKQSALQYQVDSLYLHIVHKWIDLNNFLMEPFS